MARKESFLAKKFAQGTGGGPVRSFFFYLGLLLLSYALIHTLVIVIISIDQFGAAFAMGGIVLALVFLGLTTAKKEQDEVDEEGEETQDAYAPAPAEEKQEQEK